MKKIFRILWYGILAILCSWGLLTLWVEAEGRQEATIIGNDTSGKKVLIVYDPDPFYDLDKKVCTAFGQGLAITGIQTTVATVAAARKSNNEYDLYVFCANTYNWRPDWAVTNFIKETDLQAKGVVAITLGAGSTMASQKALESLIISKGSKILLSNSLWLMRPNNKSRMDESNIKVAESMVQGWAAEIAGKIKSLPEQGS